MDKEKLTLDEGMDTIESIEAHYAKMYSDLPEDVVKMLISTHPLYGDNRDITKDNSKDFLLYKESEEPVKIKEKKINNDEENMGKEEKEEKDEKDDEEKEFMNALFSKEDDRYHTINFKKYLVPGIYLSLILVLSILSIFGFSQNSRNKDKVGELEADNKLMVKQLNDIELEKAGLLDKNINLEKEVEKLKEDSTSLNESVTETTAPATTNATTTKPVVTDSVKRTYTVASGDSLWRISKREYGSGNYYIDIMKANNIAKEGDIFVGMTLILPESIGGK